MTKLNKAQDELLTLAAKADDGVIAATEGAQATVAALIKRGLIVAAPQAGGPDRLRITTEGRTAIGEAGPLPVASSRNRQPKGAAQPASAPASPKGKIATLIDLLRRPDGATVEAMMATTAWQAHSVRAAMSGAIKKGLGLEIISAKTEGTRVYRIPTEAAA